MKILNVSIQKLSPYIQGCFLVLLMACNDLTNSSPLKNNDFDKYTTIQGLWIKQAKYQDTTTERSLDDMGKILLVKDSNFVLRHVYGTRKGTVNKEISRFIDENSFELDITYFTEDSLCTGIYSINKENLDCFCRLKTDTIKTNYKWDSIKAKSWFFPAQVNKPIGDWDPLLYYQNMMDYKLKTQNWQSAKNAFGDMSIGDINIDYTRVEYGVEILYHGNSYTYNNNGPIYLSALADSLVLLGFNASVKQPFYRGVPLLRYKQLFLFLVKEFHSDKIILYPILPQSTETVILNATRVQ